MLTKDMFWNIAAGVVGVAGAIALFFMFGPFPIDPQMVMP